MQNSRSLKEAFDLLKRTYHSNAELSVPFVPIPCWLTVEVEVQIFKLSRMHPFGKENYSFMLKIIQLVSAVLLRTQQRHMAVHVRYNSWYISLPSSAKQQREMNNFCPFWKRGEPRRIIFKIYISNFILCSIIKIILAKRNRLNDFGVSRDLQAKYKFTF